MFHRVAEVEQGLDIRTARLPSMSEEQTEDYDPLQHRDPQPQIQPWMAYFNLLRTMVGPGLLGIPVAISASGLVMGTTLTILVGILFIHTHHLLLNSLTLICKKLRITRVSYRYGFRLALLHGPSIFHGIGRRGPTIIGIFMFLSQLGICTVCVILTADSVRDIADFQTNVPAFLLLFPCYLLMEYFMKNLQRISYVALFGSALNTVGLALLLYHVFKEPIGEVVWFKTDVDMWLFSSGLTMFNLNALGLILTVEKALKDPSIMTARFGVINVGLSVATVAALLVGNLCYWAFGTVEENILRSLPFDDLTSMITIGVYLISVALMYPLQLYPGVAVIIEVIKYHSESYMPSAEILKFTEFVLRPTFVILTFIIAYYVPFQAPFVAFVGTLCTAMMCVIFPVLMDTGLRYGTPQGFGSWNFHLIKNVMILILGVIAWFFGIYYCGYVIYIRILSGYSPNSADFL